MERSKKNELNLIGYGIASDIAEKLVSKKLILTKVRASSKKDLSELKIFTPEEIDEIFDKVRRKPIPKDVMHRLISECELHCCFCWNLMEEPPIVIHHIREYHETQDNSYDNLIVLCLNHHGEVHTHRQISQQNFPPERQLDKKQKWIQALSEFRQGLRIMPGTEKQLQEMSRQFDRQEMMDTLAAALTGYPKKVIIGAIPNIHQASSMALEALDPRFQVDTAFHGNTTAIFIRAKEDIKIELKVSPQYAEEFSEKYEKLLDHGEVLDIESQAITVSGSKLLKEIVSASQGGRFKILPGHKKPAIQKISLINHEHKVTYSLNDIRGYITRGQKSFTFKGFAYNKLFEVTYRMNFAEEYVESFNLVITIHFEKWNNVNIYALPYFEPIYRFFRHLVEGWELDTTLEIDGEEMFLGGGIDFRNHEAIKQYYARLRYIFLVKKVLEYIGEQVNFKPQFMFSGEDYEKLTEIYNIISNNNVHDLKESITTSLIADDDLGNIHVLTEWKEPTSMLSYQNKQEPVTIFEKNISLPQVYHGLTKVVPKVLTSVADIKPGKGVSIEWIPKEDCQYVFGFIQSENS